MPCFHHVDTMKCSCNGWKLHDNPKLQAERMNRAKPDSLCVDCGHPASHHGSWDPRQNEEYILMILRMEKLWVYCCQLKEGSPEKQKAYAEVTKLRSLLKEKAISLQAKRKAAVSQTMDQISPKAAINKQMQSSKNKGQAAAAARAQATKAAQAIRRGTTSSDAHAAVKPPEEEQTIFAALSTFVQMVLQRPGIPKEKAQHIHYACNLIKSLCDKWKIQEPSFYEKHYGYAPGTNAATYKHLHRQWKSYASTPSHQRRAVSLTFGRTFMTCIFASFKHYIQNQYLAKPAPAHVALATVIANVIATFEKELFNPKSVIWMSRSSTTTVATTPPVATTKDQTKKRRSKGGEESKSSRTATAKRTKTADAKGVDATAASAKANEDSSKQQFLEPLTPQQRINTIVRLVQEDQCRKPRATKFNVRLNTFKSTPATEINPNTQVNTEATHLTRRWNVQPDPPMQLDNMSDMQSARDSLPRQEEAAGFIRFAVFGNRTIR